LSFHFIVRFEPLPGKEAAFSHAEISCLSINVFESLREPFVFAVHSEWRMKLRSNGARPFRTQPGFSQ
jgi:hypothetical protein